MFIKLVGYDLREGFRYNRWKLLAIFFMGLIFSGFFANAVWSGQTYFGLEEDPCLLDALCYLFRVSPPRTMGLEEEYIFPAMWTAIQAMVAFLVGYYLRQDLYTYGQQIFVRAGNKQNWWLSKCVWAAGTVTAIYLILYLSAVVVCLVMGYPLAGTMGAEVSVRLYNLDLSILSSAEQIQCVIVLPWLVSVTASLLQVAGSFVIGPFFSFMAVMAWLLTGSNSTSNWLLGKYSTILKYEPLFLHRGFYIEQGYLLAAGFILIAFAIGFLRFRSFELLERR